VLTSCCEPYLSSEYGAEFANEAPVKLLDKLLHGMKSVPEEEVCICCCNAAGSEDVKRPLGRSGHVVDPDPSLSWRDDADYAATGVEGFTRLFVGHSHFLCSLCQPVFCRLAFSCALQIDVVVKVLVPFFGGAGGAALSGAGMRCNAGL
jgi:hypothetical protein